MGTKYIREPSKADTCPQDSIVQNHYLAIPKSKENDSNCSRADAYIQDLLSPDRFFEVYTNEFFGIFCLLGLYRDFSHSPESSFYSYITSHKVATQFDNPHTKWKYLRSGVQFARDRIITRESNFQCSGVMLKKLAYKGRFKQAAIPICAPILVRAILSFFEKESFANSSVRQVFWDIIQADVISLSQTPHDKQTSLDDLKCRDALLGFQIEMLHRKNSSFANEILRKLIKIPSYDFLIAYIV